MAENSRVANGANLAALLAVGEPWANAERGWFGDEPAAPSPPVPASGAGTAPPLATYNWGDFAPPAVATPNEAAAVANVVDPVSPISPTPSLTALPPAPGISGASPDGPAPGEPAAAATAAALAAAAMPADQPPSPAAAPSAPDMPPPVAGGSQAPALAAR